TSGSNTTDGNGHAAFTYGGSAGAGTDSIQATGTVSGVSFDCTATKVWTVLNTPPTIQCPANITTNNPTGECGRTLAFAPAVTGDPAPTVTCKIGATVITSPSLFFVGPSTVTSTVSNLAC